MAIEKDIAIHHTHGIENTIAYTANKEKAEYVQRPIRDGYGMMIDQLVMEGQDQDIINALNYAQNLEKTLFSLDGDPDLLVTGVECSKDSASAEFAIIRKKYYEIASGNLNRITGTKTNKKTGETVKKESIEAYHVIQSFPEVEGLDPRLVHKIGIEYAKAAFPGHQCVVSTHMNTEHLHNHIIVNAYSMEHIGHKYRMDMAQRRRIRRINDDLSLKYGLPILTGKDLEQGKGMTWKEWKAKRDGSSWKEKLRNDILAASSMVSSWEEFKELMQGAGYRIRETENTVTYTMPGSETRKCRVRRLGPEFQKDSLCKGWKEKSLRESQAEARPVRYELEKKPFNPYHVHINRYSESGRRRSNLELLFLAAIRIIQYFKDQFLDLLNSVDQDDPANAPHTEKQDMMYRALEQLRKFEIGSKDELEKKMNETGAKLSHTRKVIRERETLAEYETDLAEKIQELLKLEKKLEEKGILPDRLFVHSYSDAEIAHRTAEQLPMTPEVRRELYRKVNEKGLYLKYKFQDISLIEARAVIDYADGKTKEMPSCLMSSEDARNAALQKQAEAEGAVPVSETSRSYDENARKDKAFELLTYHYGDEERQLLFSSRELLNELASYGISQKQLPEILAQQEEKQQELFVLKKQMIDLKNEYRELCQLKRSIELAEDNRFLCGPLFGRKIDAAPEKDPEQEPEKAEDLSLDMIEDWMSH